jgi:glutathionyl-hydroquinone reductase
MAKTVEEIIKDIEEATAEMGDDDAMEFYEKLKDEIDTMIDMIPEKDEEGEDNEGRGTGD